ncbi:MAG: prolyl oligopeptidase family serine peptidase [Micromonosporaceae bacterium]
MDREPHLAAVAGAPYQLTISDDGGRVLYLRGVPASLHVLDAVTGRERPVGPALDRYAADGSGRVVAGVRDGRLLRIEVDTGQVTAPATAGPADDPRPDPTGRRLAYLTGGTLRVIDEHGTDHLLAGEPDSTASAASQPASGAGQSARGVVWGRADPASSLLFGRHRGYWWSPDGERLLAARVDAPHGHVGAPHGPAGGGSVPVTSLHLLDLDGFWVDVRWDRQAYPHLVAVTWEPRGGPLVTVLPRSQHHALVLAVDPRTGETQVHAELDDPRWVTVTPGTPAYLPDGRVVLGGELTLDTLDTRCLFADGSLLTPPQLYVHELAGRTPADADQLMELVVQASEGEPSERHVYRVRLAPRSGHPEVTRLTSGAGVHRGYAAGGTVAVLSESLDHPGVRLRVHRAGRDHEAGWDHEAGHDHEAPAPEPATATAPPRPVFERVTDRRMPAAVLYPTGHVAGRRIAVLVQVTDGQGVVAARSAWLEHQRYAERGLAVVVVDGRGTPGVAPSFEKAVYRRPLDLMLADQVEGLAALTAKHPDLDTSRVVIRGGGVAGTVAAAAVLRHPESYHGAVAIAPVTDWRTVPAGYAERYLGTPEENPEAYARHDLTAEAAELRRPLLLTYPPDTPAEAQAVRLAEALAGSDQPHETLPTPDPNSDHVVEYEWDFIRRALGGTP